jgi:ABC-2 type transport system ATP-binding protein
VPGLAIEVQGLTRQYGSRVAVDRVSFSVQRGEIFGIIGRNGAGKTTTVECLQGLRRRTGGSIRVLGLDPASQRREPSLRIGSQLQESALPERIKVWEALDLFAGFNHVPTDWHSLLKELGLERDRKTAFANLSGGQQRRGSCGVPESSGESILAWARVLECHMPASAA